MYLIVRDEQLANYGGGGLSKIVKKIASTEEKKKLPQIKYKGKKLFAQKFTIENSNTIIKNYNTTKILLFRNNYILTGTDNPLRTRKLEA